MIWLMRVASLITVIGLAEQPNQRFVENEKVLLAREKAGTPRP